MNLYIETHKLTLTSMQGQYKKVYDFTSASRAYRKAQELCEQFNLDNFNGYEAGGIGYDYRLELVKHN